MADSLIKMISNSDRPTISTTRSFNTNKSSFIERPSKLNWSKSFMPNKNMGIQELDAASEDD